MTTITTTIWCITTRYFVVFISYAKNELVTCI